MNKKGEWSLAPAYDMTYIFNRGGYQPESEHCLLLRGKYERWTKEDVKEFAVKYGINDSEKIIRKVVDALILFRTLAEKNGVRQEWIGRIEATIHQRPSGFGVPVLRYNYFIVVGTSHEAAASEQAQGDNPQYVESLHFQILLSGYCLLLIRSIS